MSANSAVTLMKEAVDSAIKHGDIRLDAVGGHCLHRKIQACSTDPAAYSPCRLRRPSACPGNTCANGSTHGARPQMIDMSELLILSPPPGFPPLLTRPPSSGRAESQTRSGTRSLQGGCSACKAGRSRSRAVTIAPHHPPVRPTRNTSFQCPLLPTERRVYSLRPVTTCCAQGQLLSRARPSVRRHVHAMWHVRQPGDGHAPLLTARQHGSMQHLSCSTPTQVA